VRRGTFIRLVGAGALAAPFPVRAQRITKAVIGLLTVATPDASILGAIWKGLAERGYVEGRNATIVGRSADGNFDQVPTLAAELVAAQVSVILGFGGPIPARAAKAATGAIPIVFAYGGDPVLDGLVPSYNRPGGNVTGATFISSTLVGKSLQLLRDLLPRMAEVALLVNRKSTLAEQQIKDAEVAARTLGLRLRILDVSSAREIDTAFEAIAQEKVDALMVSTDPTLGLLHARQIVTLAARYSVPTIFPTRLEANRDSLMVYGASVLETVRQAAVYVGRVLDGEKPSELPILQPTTFELIVNLRTAKALGLTVPPSLLAAADELIE
jgi:putative tryptophan/tyrosine transport system substrate-binding protein